MATIRNKYFQKQLRVALKADIFWAAILATFFLLLGIAALITPQGFIVSGRIALSWILILAGSLQVLEAARRRTLSGAAFVLLIALIDLVLGISLLNQGTISLTLTKFLFGGLFVLDGILQLWFSRRTPRLNAKLWLVAGGSVTLFAGFLIFLNFAPFTINLIGWLVGIKLLFLGLTLFSLIRTRKTTHTPTARAMPADASRRIPGAAYAAYFGGAFHVGIYIGNNEIVDFMISKKVRRVPWEKFANGRPVQLWEYPDIKMAPTEKIIETALAEVGKVLPFNLFTKNCEHFVIKCLTGGKTSYSKFAQNHAADLAVAANPLMASFVVFYLRLIEYLIFKFGGFWGRRTSLNLRKTAALAINWLNAKGKTSESRPETPKS